MSIPSIPKPQNQYKFTIDNSNSPFLHPFLHKIGSRPIHPTEYFPAQDFASFPTPASHQSKLLRLESTSFTFVENVDDLHVLASKLRNVNEFAVDLEHNSYCSFQGITCLMQISTRTEDSVVDTLKLWAYIGDYLGDLFQDPTKRKVMHGANNDVLWLQRDFGIYVCNLFDTQHASRVLKHERNSLQHLLKTYCGVNANKEYQTSDWRLRPLPHDMVHYARENTHYLLHIHDLIINKLASMSTDCADPALCEVFQKSHEVSLNLYKKQIFNRETSYLYLYGLSEADLDVKQLGLVAWLFEWRDTVDPFRF